MKMVFRTLIFSAGILGLAFGYNNCNKYSFSGVTAQNNGPNGVLSDGNCGSNQFQEPNAQITNSVDILFVVHTTSSFKSVAKTVVQGLASFVNQLPAGADYQVAVMPAHSPLAVKTSGYLFAPTGTPAVSSSKTLTTAQIVTNLTNIVNASPDAVDANGKGLNDGSDEEGLASLYTGFDATHLAASRAQGFFRTNAALAVVFLANEADMCGMEEDVAMGSDKTDNDYTQELPVAQRDCNDAKGNPMITPLSVYQRIQAAQTNMGTSEPYLVAGVVYTSVAQKALANAEAEYGWGYMDTIALDAGLAVDINSNIPAGLQQIGMMTTTKLNLITDFTPTENNLDPASIAVTIDGVPTTNFTYQAATNDINIPAPGHANSMININYCQLVAQ